MDADDPPGHQTVLKIAVASPGTELEARGLDISAACAQDLENFGDPEASARAAEHVTLAGGENVQTGQDRETGVGQVLSDESIVERTIEGTSQAVILATNSNKQDAELNSRFSISSEEVVESVSTVLYEGADCKDHISCLHTTAGRYQEVLMAYTDLHADEKPVTDFDGQNVTEEMVESGNRNPIVLQEHVDHGVKDVRHVMSDVDQSQQNQFTALHGDSSEKTSEEEVSLNESAQKFYGQNFHFDGQPGYANEVARASISLCLPAWTFTGKNVLKNLNEDIIRDTVIPGSQNKVEHSDEGIVVQNAADGKVAELTRKVEQSGSDLSEDTVDKETFESIRGECVKHDEEHSEQILKASMEEPSFGVGDLVWAKVKSHPWWPGQIFDVSDASAFANKIKKPGRVLVAFFGDGTFGWLQQSQLISFRLHFEEKVMQTRMKSFCKAVAEALDEVCRRAELGLSCSCHTGTLHSAGTFPDENAGIRKGVRVNCHKDISTSKEIFNPKKTLEFVKAAACFPHGAQNLSLEASELRGHTYGIRTGFVESGRPMSDDLSQDVLTGCQVRPWQMSSTLAQNAKLKRRFSSLENDSGVVAEKGREAKKVSMGKVETQSNLTIQGGGQSLMSKSMGDSCQAKGILGTIVSGENAVESIELQSHEEDNEGTKGKRTRVMDCEGRKKARRHERAGLEGDTVGKGSDDDDAETLLALAGFHSKLVKKRGKGNPDEGLLKNAVHFRAGLINKVDGQDTRRAKEIKPVRSDLELSMTAHVSIEQAMGNPASTDLVTLDLARDSEGDTNSQNDVKASRLKDAEIFKDSISMLPVVKQQSLNADSRVKDEMKVLNGEVSPVPIVLPNNMVDESSEGKMHVSSLPSQQADDMKKSTKALNLGQYMQRVAGELTGAPPITKCGYQSSAMNTTNMKLSLKKQRKSTASELPPSEDSKSHFHETLNKKPGYTFVQLLQGLQILARDPFSNASTKRTMEDVLAGLLKFRDKVFKKSPGYVVVHPSSSEGKTDAHLGNIDHLSDPIRVSQPSFENMGRKSQKRDNSDQVSDSKLVASKSCHYSQHVTPRRQKHDVQAAQLDNSPRVIDPKPIDSTSPSAAEKTTSKKQDVQGAKRDNSDSKLKALKAQHCSENVASKLEGHVAQFEGDHLGDLKHRGSKSPCDPQNVISTGQGRDLQELALAARKRKSEILKEELAKVPKTTSSLQGQHVLKVGTSTGKFHEQGHSGKRSSGRATPSSDTRSHTEKVDRLSSQAPVGLFMKFPQTFALPSEAQLKATFARFGALQTSGIRVYKKASSAQVVFKYGRDAEMALKYAKKKSIFGQVAVTFRLRYFSHPQSFDAKRIISASGKENSSVRTDGRTSPSSRENTELQNPVANPLSSLRVDHGKTGNLADAPASHQPQAADNPINGDIAANLSSIILNPEPAVNVSSGDIQDQMIKLLRQVSVLVRASPLSTEAT